MTGPRRVRIAADYGAGGIRVQGELGTGGWEVLYQLGGQMLRVHPPGSWPIGSWQQQLLGDVPRRPEHPGR